MNNYLIVFWFLLAALTTAALGAVFSRWANKQFPPLAESYRSDPVEAFPQVWRLRTAVYSVCLTWASILSLVFLPILVRIGIVPHCPSVDALGIAMSVVFFSTALLYLIFMSLIRCPKCLRHLLIQWTERPPHAVKTKFGIDAWAAIVVKAARNHEFQCMHCGQRFFMKPEVLRSAANA